MSGIIINVILAVLLIGAVLYSINKKNECKSLEEDYFDLADRHDQVCKKVDLLSRENKLLQEENARLNQAPKAEKISKPKKTATKKTDKK